MHILIHDPLDFLQPVERIGALSGFGHVLGDFAENRPRADSVVLVMPANIHQSLREKSDAFGRTVGVGERLHQEIRRRIGIMKLLAIKTNHFTRRMKILGVIFKNRSVFVGRALEIASSEPHHRIMVCAALDLLIGSKHEITRKLTQKGQERDAGNHRSRRRQPENADIVTDLLRHGNLLSRIGITSLREFLDIADQQEHGGQHNDNRKHTGDEAHGARLADAQGKFHLKLRLAPHGGFR